MTKTKLKAWVGPLAGAILFSAAIWILHLELSVHHLKDILQHIHSLPAERIAVIVLSTTIAVAAKAESMVQKTGGHEGLLILDLLASTQWKPDCRLLFKGKVHLSRMN